MKKIERYCNNPTLFYSDKFDTPIIVYPNKTIEFLFCDVKMKWFKSRSLKMIEQGSTFVGVIG